MKKGTCFVLALTLTVTCLFSACQKQTVISRTANVNKDGYPVVDKPITLTLFGSKAPGHGDWDKMLFFKEMEKKTNIKLNFVTPSLDSSEEKKNLAFASGDLPDLFFSTQFTSSELMTYAQEKQIIPLDPYIDGGWCPNLKQILDDNPDVRKDLTAPDGHIYGLRKIGLAGRSYMTFFINTKWLAAVGMTMPKTTEDFYNAMKAFKEKDPNGNGQADEIPFSLTGTWQFNWLAGAFGVLPHDNGIFDENGTIIYAYSDDRYKEYIKWLRRLYAGGMMDSDSFTQGQPQQYAKGKDGLLGSFFTGAAFVVCGEDKDSWYDMMPPLIGPSGDQLYIQEAPRVTERANFVITAKNPYPEATMKWVDYLYSKDIGRLIDLGMEGISYKMGNNGMYEKIVPEGYANFEEYRGKELTPAPGGSIPTVSWPRQEGVVQFADSWKNTARMEKNEATYGAFAKLRYPILYFSSEDSRDISALTVDLNSYVETRRAKFIMGTENIDEKWDEYCAQIKNIGAPKLVEYYQKALDARNAAR